VSREREDTGRDTDSVTIEDVLEVFEDVAGPVVTSGDIADAFDCSGGTARRKRRALEDQDRLPVGKTADRVVWWRIDTEEIMTGFDAEDPPCSGEPLLAPEEPVDEIVDDVLYGEG
jgi:hypothetical protein